MPQLRASLPRLVQALRGGDLSGRACDAVRAAQDGNNTRPADVREKRFGELMKEQVLNLIYELQDRLAEKQPMYEADEEWRDISAAIRALENLVSKGWVK